MSGNKPKVLLIDMMSGANDFGRELALALAEKSILTVVTVNNSPLSSDGVKLRLLALFPAFGAVGGSRVKKFWQVIVAFLILFRELIGHRHDVIHIQFFRFQFLDLLVYFAFRPFLDKIIYTAHNALPHEKKWWHKTVYRWWYKTVNCTHVLSQYARESVIDFAAVRADKVIVVPHGSYSSLRERTRNNIPQSKTHYSIPEDDLLALQFGLVREYKGVDRVIALAQELSSDIKITFLIAGGGDHALIEKYQAQVAQLNLSYRIKFIPHFLDDDELAALLDISDMTLFPYHHIYQSGALMLAMTFGCTIVASDIPGFKEYVTNGEDALLCRTEDTVEFSQVIRNLCADKDYRDSFGYKAETNAVIKYGWPTIADALLKTYSETI